ncbi:MAG: acetyltransferase [Ginsengibacter sp.]
MNKNYGIYGASGHAKVIVEIIEKCGDFIKELYDDDPYKKSLLSYNVSNDKLLLSVHDIVWIIAIGNNMVRKKIATTNLLTYGKVIDIKSNLSLTSEIGTGTVIMPGVTINSCTEIGIHSIINTNASVDHDCTLGNYVHVSPNATLCGGVTIGEGTQIGAGAVITPGVHIGKWTIIGAGSIIIKDIPDQVTVVGNPGKVIKSNNWI